MNLNEAGGAEEASYAPAPPPNKPMHPTADTGDVINLHGTGRRVIGGVRRNIVKGNSSQHEAYYI